jgi:tape measure domain-containing protein|nr:MAG TPA: Minor tail protein [Caudoviricetes sp.]
MDDSQLRLVIEAQNRASKTLSQIQRDVEKLSSSMKSSMSSAAGSTSSFASKAASALDGMASGIMKLIKTAAAFTAGGAFGGKYFIDLASSLQMTQRQIGVLTGSVGEANKVFGQLYNYTLGKPIAFPDASKAAKTLLGYGRTTQTVVKDMDTLSRMSIVNGADLQALALVFGQVTSRGALFGQDALQLINNNIPLTTILARHFGISMQEASEKINGGKVKAEEFVKAMENYAASLDIGQMTDTFQNRMISLSGTIRSVGLEILGIKIDPIKGMVIEAGGLFDQMSNRVTETTKLIKEHREEIVKVVTFVLQNAVPALKVLIGMYVAAKAAALGFKTAVAVSDISKGWKDVTKVTKEGATAWTFVGAAAKTAVRGITSALGVMGTVGKVVFSGLSSGAAGLGAAISSIPIIGWIAIVITAVVGFVAWLYATNEGFRNFVNGVVGQIGAVLGQIGAVIGSVIGNVASVIGSVIGVVVNIVGTIAGAIGTAARTIGSVIGVIVGVVAKGISIVVGVISTIVGVISNVISTILTILTPVFQIVDLIITAIVGFGQIVWTIFSGIAEVVWTIISTIVQIIGVVLYGTIMAIWNNVLVPFGEAVGYIFTHMGEVISAVMTFVITIVSTVWNAIVAVVTPILQVIWTVISTVFNAIVGVISSVMSAIWGVITAVWNAILPFIQPILNVMSAVISTVFGGIAAVVNSLMNAIKTYIINPVATAVSYVVGTVGQIATSIKNAVQNAYNAVAGFIGNFTSAGKNLIDGLVKGVMGAKDAVVNKIKEICSGALDAVKNFFGIKSPSRVMAQMGKFMMQGWSGGLESMRDAVVKTATDIASDVYDGLSGDMSLGGLSFAGSGINGSGATLAGSGGVTNVSNSGGNRNTTNQFNGQIVINTPEAADAFFKRLDRDGDLASMGVPT